MSRWLRSLLFVLCLASPGFAVGCGGSSTGLIPVDSPLIQFQPPDEEDLLPDTDYEDEDFDEDTGAEAGDDSAGEPGKKAAPAEN